MARRVTSSQHADNATRTYTTKNPPCSVCGAPKRNAAEIAPPPKKKHQKRAPIAPENVAETAPKPKATPSQEYLRRAQDGDHIRREVAVLTRDHQVAGPRAHGPDLDRRDPAHVVGEHPERWVGAGVGVEVLDDGRDRLGPAADKAIGAQRDAWPPRSENIVGLQAPISMR